MKRSVILMLAIGLISGIGLAQNPIFDSIPDPLPGSFPSQPFQAQATDEVGDHIAFAGVDRDLGSVVVSLTNWACENDFDLVDGSWIAKRGNTDPCVTKPGTGFVHPITLNLYKVDDSSGVPEPGELIVSKTQDSFIPFRPSYGYDQECTAPAIDTPFGGTWYDTVLGFCVHGFAFEIVFDFSADDIALPDEVIYGIAYNTQTYGAEPIEKPGPYNSLNVSLDTQSPSIGTDVEPGTMFWDTSVAGWYCDGGASGIDTFRRDAGCWGPYAGVIQFNALLPMPKTKDDCKKGGWMSLFRENETSFKNQGDCIQYVNTGK